MGCLYVTHFASRERCDQSKSDCRFSGWNLYTYDIRVDYIVFFAFIDEVIVKFVFFESF